MAKNQDAWNGEQFMEDRPGNGKNVAIEGRSAQPKLDADQQQATDSGNVTGSGPTGAKYAVPPYAYHIGEARPHPFMAHSFTGH